MTSEDTKDNKRIIKNTLLLYIRMFFVMGVTLYTSRLVLAALGVEDYGIYNVVGGVVATMAFLNTTLTTATTRFITYEIGIGGDGNLKRIFSNCLAAHWMLVLLVVVIVETLGIWFLNTHMNIPENRMFAANIVLQCAVGSFAMNILSVPYNGLIIAHEKMGVFAYIGILETMFKLGIAYVVTIAICDRLILYACLWLFVSIVIRFTYNLYCMRHWEESRTAPRIEKGLFRSILKFTGFNLMEVFANMMADQGVNLLLNIHFGPVVNAARGIAVQTNSALNGFVNNFTTATNPQIMKCYADGNHTRMWNLVEVSNKMSFYLLLLLATPIFFKIHDVLYFWLGNPPSYSAIFIRLLLLTNLTIMPTRAFYTVISATGDIKRYQISFGLYRLTVFPVCWIFLNFISNNPVAVYYIFLVYEVVGTLVKLLLIKQKMNYFSMSQYCKRILLPCIMVFGSVFFSNYLLYSFFISTISGFIFYIIVSICITLFFVFVLGLNWKERRLAINYCKNKFRHI